jgi:class 3 adenylate cyclase
MNIARLFGEWRDRADKPLTVERYREIAAKANEHGESLLAFDVAREGLEKWKKDTELRRASALALARIGSTDRAREILFRLRDEGEDDEETAGLLARTYKDVWERTGAVQDLKAAFDAYLKAYDHRRERYWTGINAATLAFALRDGEKARNLAGMVLESCRPNPADYWVTATIAEATLLLGDIDQAARLYAHARTIGTLGNILSTWRNAQIILRLIPGQRARIEEAFRPPKAAVFRGEWDGVKEDLSFEAGVAYSLGATLADLEFLERTQKAGGQTYVVLAYNEEQFVRDHAAAAGDEWNTLYWKVRAAATDVIVCTNHKLKFGNIDAEYALDVMCGLAGIRARQLGTELKSEGKRLDAAPNAPLSQFPIARRAMIFADVFHFSRLSDEEMPAFLTEVMARVAALSRNAEVKPEFQNTWGDGLFFVFKSVAEAGRFALKLVSSIAAIDHEAAGLRVKPALRIGLHAGPVYTYSDELIGRENYIGSHVNRAARIEPVTPPGKIYASDAFAALATLEAAGQFRFDYVGRRPLAKDFGAYPMYQLRGRAH